MIVDDAKMLMKLKQARLTDKQIAARLGISLEEVDRRWKEISAAEEEMLLNGYGDLVEQFNVLAHQYQLVGESLKFFGEFLSQTVTAREVAQIIQKSPEDPEVKELMKNFIILKPFTLRDAEKALEQSIQSN